MQTKCPKCTIIFKVTEQLLSVADGQVRCSNCKHVFDGRQHLLDQVKRNKTVKTQDTSNEFSVADIKRHIRHHGTSTGVFYSWLAAAFIVTILLIGQILWINKNHLAEHPDIGSAVTKICQHIPSCVIEAKRDSNAFTLSSRQIFSHPNEEKALILSANFTNTAHFAQPFPLLLVSMSDKQGNVIAERYFRPEEYRLANEYNEEIAEPSYVMQPNESININLALADPGKDALAFEIDFL